MIERGEKARAQLNQLADQAAAQGDTKRYWALVGPSNLGDLYRIVGDRPSAMRHYERNSQYWPRYRAWLDSTGGSLPPSYAEASDYLMAGQRDLARETLLAVHRAVDDVHAELLGIPLICSGAQAEGTRLLDRRLARLRQLEPQDATICHQQGEVLFWLGDLNRARTAAQAAVERWPEPQVPPSVLALPALFTALGEPRDQVAVTAATTAVEAATVWFFEHDRLIQAVDAREYQSLIEQNAVGQQPSVAIRGLTMLWT